MNTEKTFADRLKELRNIRNYTQEELGKITNISVQSIRRYEQGRLNEEPSAYNLLQLAKALDVTPEYLLIGDNNMTSYTEAIKRELKQLNDYGQILPLSVFLQLWRNFCYAIPGSWAGKQIERALDERNLKKANLLHLTVVPLSIGIPSALLVFIALFFGSDGINSVLNMIPEVVLNGFNVAAGVLSCVGLALLIKIMSNNKILPYLFLGFVAVMYLGMDVIGVAVVGLCIAFLVVNNMQFEEEDDF